MTKKIITNLSINDFLEKFGKKAVAIVSYTKEAKCKKNTPFTITKESVYHGMSIGLHYEKSVQNAQERCEHDRDFSSDSSYAIRVNDFVFEKVSDNKKYLRLQFSKAQAPFIKTTCKWFIDGREVSYDVVEPYLYSSEKIKERKPSKKQIENGVDAEKEVVVLNLVLSQVTEIEQGGLVWKKE